MNPVAKPYQGLTLYKEYDPTRTTALRNLFAKDMRSRFAKLTKAITQKVVVEDCFGLTDTVTRNAERATFAFPSSKNKVEMFMKWLGEQTRSGILEVKEYEQLGQAADSAWTNKYITDSYKRGVIRSRYELQKAGFNNVPTMDETGGVEMSMATPFHMDRVGLIYSRVYSDLKNITNTMDNQISKVLAQGIADGDNPRLLARKMVAAIDGTGMGELGITDTLGRFIPAARRAEMLARTEVVRAHHLAAVQEYKNWGLLNIQVQVEWITAEDSRVCPQCAEMHGKVYTLEQIEGMIPKHPQCRCIALPIPEGYYPTEESPEEGIKEKIPSAPKSPYDYALDNGFTTVHKYDPNPGKDDDKARNLFNKRFDSIMGKFNFAELNSDINEIAKARDIIWVNKRIYYSEGAANPFQIAYEGTWEGKPVNIVREFNKYSVDHYLFELPDEIQGKGIAKDVLRAYYKQYQKMGLDSIDIYANLDVGGYAWGKYGFEAKIDGVNDLIELYEIKGAVWAEEARDIFENYLALNPGTDTFPMNFLADTDFGEEMLKGKSWHGVLRMYDPVQRERFEKYLYYTKKK